MQMVSDLAWYPCLYHRTWLPWECPTPPWVILFFVKRWRSTVFLTGVSFWNFYKNNKCEKMQWKITEQVQWACSVSPDFGANKQAQSAEAQMVRDGCAGQCLDGVAQQPCTGTPLPSSSAAPWMFTTESKLKLSCWKSAFLPCMSSRS